MVKGAEMKELIIKTTYKSIIKISDCFHIHATMEKLKIVYLHNNEVKEMYLKLSEVSEIEIKVRG